MSHWRVSVVIPVYNVVSYLDEAIHSILSQDFSGIQIIVVNDGSHAEATEEIKRICAPKQGVFLFHQENRGQAQARRHGLRYAMGNYVMFLDADDTLLPGAVSYLVSALENTPSAIASYGVKRIVYRSEHHRPAYILPTQDQIVSGNLLPALLQAVPLLSNGSVCIRREVAEQLIFPEKIYQGEDWITWCRLALKGDIVCAGHQPVLRVNMHGDNVSGQVFSGPRRLLEALDFVYEDADIAARVSKDKLREYRALHTRHIHTHLSNGYRERKLRLPLVRHMAQRAYWDYLYRRRRQKNFEKLLDAFRTRIRVLHVVKYFFAGGAERLISSILQHSNREQYEHIVLSLSDKNERLKEIQNTLGIPYISIDIQRDKNNIVNYMKCFLLVRKLRPDVIKTWLPPSNIDGGKIGKRLGIPVIWGIHDARLPKVHDTIRQLHLSHTVPDRIICCSRPVYDTCITAGYDRDKLVVVNNGTDTVVFSHRPEGRKRIRTELGIGGNVPVVGMAAEYIPLKRHSQFLVASKILLSAFPDAQFILCGRGTDAGNMDLVRQLKFLEIEKHVHLLGIRDDMADLFSAMDVCTLNSVSESFGLAITEAMACQTLCVATDTGIMKELLKGIGEVIPITDDPHVLMEAWKYMLSFIETEKSTRRERGRAAIVQHYSIVETARKYDQLYNSVRSQKYT